MKRSGIIFDYDLDRRHRRVAAETTLWEQLALPYPQARIPKQKAPQTAGTILTRAGIAIVALAIGGMLRPVAPQLMLETAYRFNQTKTTVVQATKTDPTAQLPKAAPVLFDPLKNADGTRIVPADAGFSIVIPKIGVNSTVLPSVDPTDPKEYEAAMDKAVAHASTSFFPDENGVVYLFSHSTNYEWFVKDLNAVFYLVKNLDTGDLIVLVYKGKTYTYRLREKRIVNPNQVSYMAPIKGTRTLILQTCWPPGSTTQRLLLFADLIEEQSASI